MHGIEITFRISHPTHARYTKAAVSLIKSTLAHIFRSEEHLSFEYFIVAVDQLSALSLTAEEVRKGLSWDCGEHIKYQISTDGARGELKVCVLDA